MMSLVNKIEDMVFGSRALTSVEILKDRLVVLNMRCIIDKLDDEEISLLTGTGVKYTIRGNKLQIREYGDTYVKVEGEIVTGILIDGGSKHA